MQADTTKVQGLCGKRRMPEGEGSSMDKNYPPSKFPKLHNESILPFYNTDDIFFVDASTLSTNVFPDLLLQEKVDQSNAQNSGNTETTFCGVPSPCWDCFSSDVFSHTSLSEDNCYCCNTFDRSNYDSWSSAFDNNFCANGINDWINQPEVNSNLNGVQLTSSVMNQLEVHPNSVQLAGDENCETNKDLDLTYMEPDLHEFVCENNGTHVDNGEPDSDEPDIPQPQSEVPEVADSSDDSVTVATIDSKTRSKNHAPFEISDEFKQNDLTKTSFAFVQPKFGKQRKFIVAILKKSCSALIISLRGLPEFFRVKHSSYSRDNQQSLSFNRNDFGDNRIVSFYLQNLKKSYKNVEKIGCTLEFKFIFDDSEPIIVTLDDLYVANHKYESGKKIKGQKRPVASTVVVTNSCEVEIVNQFDDFENDLNTDIFDNIVNEIFL